MKLTFSRDDHSYQVGEHKFKHSVTGLASQFFPNFPKETIAEAMAKKNGDSAEDIIAEWDLNASLSTIYGNAIHKAIEYWIKHQKIPKHPYLAEVVEKWREIWPIDARICAEMAVFSQELSLCGTMDILEITGQKRGKIHDIKTNADLEKANGKMKDPFKDLHATPLNKYRLQLSLYKHLMELLGWKIEGLYLWHWTTDWKQIELQDLDVTKIWTKTS